jgi:ribosomal-protein-alanine N-acetyltransferase
MLHIQILPFPVLTTGRCILEEITMDDVQDFLKLNAEPQVIKYLDRGSLSGIDDATKLIDRIKEDEKNNRGIMWKITLKELGQKMVGMIGFWRFMPEHHRAEVAFMLLPEYWNRGLIREALSEVVHYAFHSLKLHSIEANVNPENVAARQMLSRCSFIQEGYFRENYYYDGKFLDTVTFSCLNLQQK